MSAEDDKNIFKEETLLEKKDAQNQDDNDAEEFVRIEKEQGARESASIIRKSENDDSARAPLWLITFTDVMALMLTFFVLLYSMSSPQEEKWEEMSKGLTKKLNVFNAADYKSGKQDVISLDKIDTMNALNVGYIKVLISRLFVHKDIGEILLIENGKRLVVSLPSDLLFESGQVEIGDAGKRTLFDLGGILARVKNRMEVVGHSDPRPITNPDAAIYKTNWQLSLARAAEVARVLKDVGYQRDIIVRGVSSARYDELPEQLSEEERYALSRRVDIVIMSDSGYRLNAFDM